jgi:S-adenosylmethionine synthetase
MYPSAPSLDLDPCATIICSRRELSVGHPDKSSDQIPNAVVDRFLAEDPEAPVAYEPGQKLKAVA